MCSLFSVFLDLFHSAVGTCVPSHLFQDLQVQNYMSMDREPGSFRGRDPQDRSGQSDRERQTGQGEEHPPEQGTGEYLTGLPQQLGEHAQVLDRPLPLPEVALTARGQEDSGLLLGLEYPHHPGSEQPV